MTYQSFSISGWGSSPRISSGPPAGASSPPASTAAAPCSERSTAPASSAMSIRSGARPRADSPSPPQPAHQGKELVHDQVHETEKHRDDRDRHQRHDGVGDQFLSVGPYDLPQLGTGFADEPAYSRRKRDRKSTRLNSSHVKISYAVCCLKKKRQTQYDHQSGQERRT